MHVSFTTQLSSVQTRRWSVSWHNSTWRHRRIEIRNKKSHSHEGASMREVYGHGPKGLTFTSVLWELQIPRGFPVTFRVVVGNYNYFLNRRQHAIFATTGCIVIQKSCQNRATWWTKDHVPKPCRPTSIFDQSSRNSDANKKEERDKKTALG